MTQSSSPPARRRRPVRAATAAIGAAALAAALAPAATAASAASQPAPSRSHVLAARGSTVTLHRIGTVSLRALARADALRNHESTAAPSSAHVKMTPLRRPANAKALSRAARAHQRNVPATAVTTAFAGNVKGEHGFDGITAAINGGANSPELGGVGDTSPPDQALAVGPSTDGTAIVEYVNDTLNIYAPDGKTLLGAIPGYQIYGQYASTLLADPRAYRDPQTGHWFLTQFTVGDGFAAPLSTQYIAVSQTTSPFGPYTTFSIDTSDSSQTARGCPCLGDFDQVGMNDNGFFIATNEYSVDGPNFNGAVIYAMSKRALISAAMSLGRPVPVVQRYVVRPRRDRFGAYHLSPSAVTPGSPAPNTEYFVESNSHLKYGTGLNVYALLDTALLSSGKRPRLVETHVGSEAYSFPPGALQRSGPTPYGCSLNFCATGSLQTDFNAVQEVTYASGQLYGELSTGFNYGTGQNSGIAWFVLHPVPHRRSVTVSLVRDGYVETPEDLLYPVIGVNKSGTGYLTFAISSSTRYPSTAYMAFNASKGPRGPIHIAASGANPLDDFTCYPLISSGQCRYGDYSMAQYYNGQIYMASEYVAPQPRDPVSDWSTRVWYAPVP